MKIRCDWRTAAIIAILALSWGAWHNSLRAARAQEEIARRLENLERIYNAMRGLWRLSPRSWEGEIDGDAAPRKEDR